MNCSATSAVALPSIHSRCMPSSLRSGRMTARAIKACKSTKRLGGDGFMRQKMRSFKCLAMNIIKGRNAIVPFEQRGSPTHARDRAPVELPNRIEYWMIMRVENIFLELGMACDMDLRHAVGRHCVDIPLRIEPVIFRRDVDVIYIE